MDSISGGCVFVNVNETNSATRKTGKLSDLKTLNLFVLLVGIITNHVKYNFGTIPSQTVLHVVQANIFLPHGQKSLHDVENVLY